MQCYFVGFSVNESPSHQLACRCKIAALVELEEGNYCKRNNLSEEANSRNVRQLAGEKQYHWIEGALIITRVTRRRGEVFFFTFLIKGFILQVEKQLPIQQTKVGDFTNCRAGDTCHLYY